jgi:hypothetical protein
VSTIFGKIPVDILCCKSPLVGVVISIVHKRMQETTKFAVAIRTIPSTKEASDELSPTLVLDYSLLFFSFQNGGNLCGQWNCTEIAVTICTLLHPSQERELANCSQNFQNRLVSLSGRLEGLIILLSTKSVERIYIVHICKINNPYRLGTQRSWIRAAKTKMSDRRKTPNRL